jgi:hypothetical protein
MKHIRHSSHIEYTTEWDITAYTGYVSISYTYRWHLRFGRGKGEWQQKRKIKIILSISFLVLFSVGLVLGVISHLCTRKKTDTHGHSHENNESSIHGNMKYNKNGHKVM